MNIGKTMLLLVGLSVASACGAQPRRPPNDEVSTPMEAEDMEALDQSEEPPADAGPSE